jgi:hypothetical protein
VSDSLAEYRALVEKVDAFFGRVHGRYGDRMRCAAGCSGCCGHHLTVSRVEAESIARHLSAMPAGERAALRARAAALGSADGPCPALDAGGRCGIYEARPLICRTQGLPMRVGSASLPVLGEADAQGLSVCPLNFEGEALSAVDADCVLNVETIDATLAVVNRRAFPDAPLERVRIGSLF